jgi:hypothetical protein
VSETIVIGGRVCRGSALAQGTLREVISRSKTYSIAHSKVNGPYFSCTPHHNTPRSQVSVAACRFHSFLAFSKALLLRGCLVSCHAGGGDGAPRYRVWRSPFWCARWSPLRCRRRWRWTTSCARS